MTFPDAELGVQASQLPFTIGRLIPVDLKKSNRIILKF
ncbi:hypothetical protein COO91_04740 [Nostoc flagelliforme CCNUN1]|uniref:Uncharacterized protein n=1 Tax=Nostoc flagelliforme CCNUN1 TaxID=2038116 RepID=A0A2K8SVG9_9NOSO|nr:hypothetical protein COO91_04740 [Nostoc flagelliforme CCNUN1]